jgi:uncharacterized membrane protein
VKFKIPSKFFVSLMIMATIYFGAGLNHFISFEFYLPMMPPWIPFHKLCILLSGFIEITFAVMLLFQSTRRWASWGIILLLIAFMPVHIYMYQMRETLFKDISIWLIVGRIPMQLALMTWAYIYSRPPNQVSG